MAAVVEIVAIIDVGDVNVVGVIPVGSPGLGPRIDHTDPVTSVLETGKSANNQKGPTVNPKPVFGAKVYAEAIIWNAVAVVTSALLPCAVVRLPAFGTVRLPCSLTDMLLLRRYPARLLAAVDMPGCLRRSLLLGMVLLIVLIRALLLSMLRLLFFLRPILARCLPLSMLIPLVLPLGVPGLSLWRGRFLPGLRWLLLFVIAPPLFLALSFRPGVLLLVLLLMFFFSAVAVLSAGHACGSEK